MSKIDIEILKSFYDSPGIYQSGEDLARRMGVSRAAVWSHIQELKEAGLPIEAVPNQGYRLAGECPNLIAADIKARLKTRIVGGEILVFQETDSTQAIVEQLARDGVREGLVVFAESQRRGRGRLGRTWVSPAKTGLWFSMLLRPDWRPDEVTRLTVLAAVGIARALEKNTSVPVEIKYPNDLMVEGRKICGILTEMRMEVDRVQYVIVGAGLNVNAQHKDFPSELRSIATSLAIEGGHPLGRPGLAAAILTELDTVYLEAVNGGFARISEEWSNRCTTLGKRVTAVFGEQKVTGEAFAIDEQGALLVKTAGGRIETLRGGDITLEKR